MEYTPYTLRNFRNIKQLNDITDDPMFKLTFPQKDMLSPAHYEAMSSIIKGNADKSEIKKTANKIRTTLNPHPAGQLEYNVPTVEGEKLYGMQNKYRETVLFFSSQEQTRHAYCTFCFRWPQFVGADYE